MGVLDCYLMFLTVIHFHSTDILGYENKCECGTIRKVLTKEIFDLKFENSMLTSRIEQIESVLKGDPSVAGLVSSADNGRLQALENKVSTIEVKLQDRGEFSRGSVELNSLIARTMRSEKKKRLQTEFKVENGLKKINESFKVINAQIDARFDSYENTISDQIDEYKNRLTENVSQVENKVHTIYATVANLENRTEKLIKSEISTLQTDIETVSKDVSRMDDDISSVIDIVLLDKKATCTPSCTNGGVCFKGNSCRCKHLAGGGRCENFICEDECYENGGECVGPGKCKCSEGRSGRNCELIMCPELPRIQNGRIFQDTSDGIRNNYKSVATYTCNPGYWIYSMNEYTRRCQADGTWTGETPYCDDNKTCKQPEPVENAVLRQEYANKDKFNDEEIVAYDCALGYSIAGRSRERHCNKGRWSNVRFKCTLITCPYMDHPEHGRQDANNGAGQYARFECDIGYTLKGPDKLLCRTDGRWSPSNPPTCAPILCPELPRIQRGRIFQDTSDGIRNNYQSVAEYTCNRGYLLNDNKQRYTRKCQADGSWTGEQPYCDIPRCEIITPFYGGGIMYFGDRKRWSQAFYSCDDAYSLIPNWDESECTDNLKWEPSPPQCLKKAKVEKPDHSYVRGARDVLLHGESYKLYCSRGYQLYRDGYLQKLYETIRNNNGTLVPQVPKCVQEILE